MRCECALSGGNPEPSCRLCRGTGCIPDAPRTSRPPPGPLSQTALESMVREFEKPGDGMVSLPRSAVLAMTQELRGLRRELSAADELVEALLNQKSPWPLDEVLRQLANWMDHLNDHHNCDCHGYEARRWARDEAREILGRIPSALEAWRAAKG